MFGFLLYLSHLLTGGEIRFGFTSKTPPPFLKSGEEMPLVTNIEGMRVPLALTGDMLLDTSPFASVHYIDASTKNDTVLFDGSHCIYLPPHTPYTLYMKTPPTYVVNMNTEVVYSIDMCSPLVISTECRNGRKSALRTLQGSWKDIVSSHAILKTFPVHVKSGGYIYKGTNIGGMMCFV